jgi:hypothetical protein
MRRLFLTAVALVAFAGPAIAFHCPRDIAAIDAALAKNPDLTAEQKTEVMTRRAEGEKLHNSGKHQESVDTLAKAMEILGIK